MATGENVLWIVTKTNYIGRVNRRWVFRTYKAAREFRKSKMNHTHKFYYNLPQRATWGPEQ